MRPTQSLANTYFAAYIATPNPRFLSRTAAVSPMTPPPSTATVSPAIWPSLVGYLMRATQHIVIRAPACPKL
jgi:hypothetical protein